MAENNNGKRVAVACQGGGSHTAFTAGALKKLLREKDEKKHNYEIVALSGTSGGAICALLAWYGLLTNDENKAIELLDSFWRDNSANSFWDKFLNDWFLQMNRFFANTGGAPTISPYFYPSWGRVLGWLVLAEPSHTWPVRLETRRDMGSTDKPGSDRVRAEDDSEHNGQA